MKEWKRKILRPGRYSNYVVIPKQLIVMAKIKPEVAEVSILNAHIEEGKIVITYEIKNPSEKNSCFSKGDKE